LFLRLSNCASVGEKNFGNTPLLKKPPPVNVVQCNKNSLFWKQYEIQKCTS